LAIIVFVIRAVYVKWVLRQLTQEHHENFTYIKLARILNYLFNTEYLDDG